MKNFAVIIFALVLLLATLEADGERLTLEEEEAVIIGGQAGAPKLGRKAVDVGAKEYKDPTANKGLATGKTAEDNSAVGLVDSLEGNNVGDDKRFRPFPNPYLTVKHVQLKN